MKCFTGKKAQFQG